MSRLEACWVAITTRLMSTVQTSEAAIIAKEVNAQFLQPQNAGLVAFFFQTLIMLKAGVVFFL